MHDADGPFFLVQLDKDDPWISAIVAASMFLESYGVGAHLPPGSTRLDWLKAHAEGELCEYGTILTKEEVLFLENGQELIDEFLAGDTRRRDRQELPGMIEMTMEDIVKYPDRTNTERRAVHEMEVRLRELNA